MNDVLSIAIQHHFYIFPLALVGLWLLSRWSAEPKRKARPVKEATGRAKAAAPIGVSQPPTRDEGDLSSTALNELRERSNALALQRAELRQEIGALDGSGARGSTSGSKRKRKR